MKIIFNRIGFFIFLEILFLNVLFAEGISVDAGLTPPQDRIILRTQYRYMSMDNTMMSMQTHMTPLVLAYGVSPGFTVMTRAMYVHRTISDPYSSSNGINDLYILSKFSLLRKNTARYVYGIATYLATNIPVGSTKISSRTWNPEVGLNFSFRPRFFSLDFSTSYIFSDVSGSSVSQPGNLLNFNFAFSALVPLKYSSSFAYSPVVEITYNHQGQSEISPKNEILFISPGLTFIYSDLALEALVQVPVYQSEQINSTKQNSRLIFGIKYMF